MIRYKTCRSPKNASASPSGIKKWSQRMPIRNVSTRRLRSYKPQPTKTPLPQRGAFLELPPELRIQIYELLLGESAETLVIEAKWEFRCESTIAVKQGSGIDSTILHTCHQIYYEARDVLYAKRTFQFDSPPALALFWRNLRPDTAIKISSLKVADKPGEAVNLEYGNDTKPVELLLAGEDRVIVNDPYIAQVPHPYQENILHQSLLSRDIYSDIPRFRSTPFADACLSSSDDVVKLLVRYGAFVNGFRHTIGRPLACAVQKGRESLVRYLLDEGADINAQRSISALIVACNEGHYNIAEYLINRGANVNARTNCGSPLSRACAMGHKNIVLLLIRNGAKINYPIEMDHEILQSEYGLVPHYSPLYHAVLGRHKTVVELLFQHGAQTHILGTKLEREIRQRVKKMGVATGASYCLRNS